MKFQFSPYIAIQIKDYEKAIDFYQRVLEMNLTESNEKETYLRCEPINFCYEKHGMPGKVFFELEPVGQPGRWNTLRALRVLKWWTSQQNLTHQ